MRCVSSRSDSTKNGNNSCISFHISLIRLNCLRIYLHKCIFSAERSNVSLRILHKFLVALSLLQTQRRKAFLKKIFDNHIIIPFHLYFKLLQGRKKKHTCFLRSHSHWAALLASHWDFHFQTVRTNFQKYLHTCKKQVLVTKTRMEQKTSLHTCSSWMALRWDSIVFLFSWSLLSICKVSESIWTFQLWIFSTSSNSFRNTCLGLLVVWGAVKKNINYQFNGLTASIATFILAL